MKNHSKQKTNAYMNVVIQDENGLDTIRVKKDAFASLSGSRTRQKDAGRTAAKANA